MADELPPAVAKFIADMSQFTGPLRDGITAVQDWGDRTDEAMAKAEAANLDAKAAQDKATQSMNEANDAAERYARGEITAEEATKAVADAQRDQESSNLAQAKAQQAVADATNRNSESQRNLAHDTKDATNEGFMAASMLQKIWIAAGFATGSLEPLAAGLIAVTGGLLSGITAAGIGLGVFGAVTKSAFAQVTAANQAGTKLTGSLGSMQRSLASVTGEWNHFVDSNTNGVAKIISEGVGLLPRVLQLIQPFLAPTEQALTGFVRTLQQALAPAQHFSDTVEDIAHHAGMNLVPKGAGTLAQFMQTMAANAGPALTKILTAVSNLAGGFAHLLITFAPFAQTVLSGLDQMTAGFDRWAAGLSKTQGFQEFMTMVKTQGPTIVSTLKNLATVAGQFIKDMSGSASNMLWLKALPQISQFAAAFMKANPSLVKTAMNIMLVVQTGKQLLGWAKTGTSAIKDFYDGISGGIGNVKNLVAGFRDSDAAASKATGAWGTAGGKISSALSGIGKLGSGAWSALKSVGGWLGDAAKSAGTFAVNIAKAGAQAALAGIKMAAMAIKTAAVKAAQLAASAATKIWTGVQAAFDIVMDANPIFLVVAACVALVAVVVLCYIHFKAFRDIVNDVGRAIRTAFVTAFHAVEAAVVAVINFIKAHWKLILGIILGPIALAVALVVTYWKQIQDAFKDCWAFCKKVVSDALAAIKDVVESVFSWMRSFISSEIDDVKSVLNWFSELGALFRGWWDEAVNAVTSTVSQMLSFVASIPHRILSALGNLGGLLVSAGQDLVRGLINGVTSMFGAVASTAENLVSSLGHTVLSLLDIGSPSKVAHWWGEMTGQGLVNGLLSMVGRATSAAKQLAGGVTTGLGQAGAGVQAGTLRTLAPAPAAAAGNGTVTVMVDGQKLFSILQSQLYRYNIRNSGTVTGVVKPV